MPTYKYVGDLPTVFISLTKDGRTFMPSKGDTIDWPVPIGHPLLELVVETPAPVVEKAPETKVGGVEKVIPEQEELAAAEAPDITRSGS